MIQEIRDLTRINNRHAIQAFVHYCLFHAEQYARIDPAAMIHVTKARLAISMINDAISAGENNERIAQLSCTAGIEARDAAMTAKKSYTAEAIAQRKFIRKLLEATKWTNNI
jgi:hypothetical protein